VGFELFLTAEEKYQAEIIRLTEVAEEVYKSDRGSFLKAQADAWCKADWSDKRILKSAWTSIIVKYSLEEEGW